MNVYLNYSTREQESFKLELLEAKQRKTGGYYHMYQPRLIHSKLCLSQFLSFGIHEE